jgi:hypothetical protein
VADDTESTCLLERLQRPRKVADGALPDGTPIKWRLLTASEKQVAKGKARARLVEVGIDPDNWMSADVLDQEIGYQTLAFAARDPLVKGNGRHVFPRPVAWTLNEETKEKAPDAGKLRDILSVDECASMLDEYLDFEEAQNPALEKLTEEQAAEILEAVKKKDRVLLKDFGADRLALYLLTTASQQSTSPTGKSSSSPASTEQATEQKPSPAT